MTHRITAQPLSLLFFGAFFLALSGQLAYEAFFVPSVQFLRPATDGRWIVHPNLQTGQTDLDFVREFTLASVPAALPVRISAMRHFAVTVNGQALAVDEPANWKTAVTLDLAPALAAGRNDVKVHVSNSESPPALLVEGPEPIRTDSQWGTVQPSGNIPCRSAVIAEHGEDFLAASPNVLEVSPRRTQWIGAFVAYLLFVAFAMLPRRRSQTANDDDAAPAAPSSAPWMHVLTLLLFALVAAVHLRNATAYPATRGFDPVEHADYVRYLVAQRNVPFADQGWEMSQPPLYYALGAVVYSAAGGKPSEPDSLKTLQLLSALMTLGTLAVAWWMLAILHPAATRMRVMGFAVAALLPVTFYLAPQVSNETLAACVISGAIAIATRQAARRAEGNEARWRDAALLGLACGLGLLSKYTGLFVFLAVLASSGLRVLAGSPDGPRRRDARPFSGRIHQLGWTTVLATVTIAISGWLYARNFQKFGTPFIGAWDDRSHFHIVHPPGYHTLEYYARFGSVFWMELSRTNFVSFWDGMYAALWGDSYRTYLAVDSPGTAALTVACLWLGLLPTAAIILGFALAVRRLLTQGWSHPYFVPVITSALTVTALISFSLEHPFYSMQKAHWALSLVPSVAVFAALGLESMCRRLGPLRWAVHLDLAALAIVVPTLFWYRGPA